MNLYASGLDNIFYEDSVDIIMMYIANSRAEILQSNNFIFEKLNTLPTDYTRLRWGEITPNRVIHPQMVMHSQMTKDINAISYFHLARRFVEESFSDNSVTKIILCEDTFSDNALSIEKSIIPHIVQDMLLTPAHKYMFSENLRFLVNITAEGSIYFADLDSMP